MRKNIRLISLRSRFAMTLKLFVFQPAMIVSTGGYTDSVLKGAVHQLSAIDFNQTGHLIANGVISS